ALGVIIISRAESFATNVTSVLFGDVLGVTWGDVRGQAVGAAAVVAASAVLHRPFMALAFHQDKAATLGLRPALTHAALIGPPATASLLVRRVPLVMVAAVALSAATVVAGLAISFHHDTAGGATIAGLAVGEFFAVLAAQEATRAVRAASRRHAV